MFQLILAEDDPRLQIVLSRMLTEHCCSEVECTIVGSGDAALLAYERGGADMVITDDTMPAMDGLNLTRSLRARGAQLPILLVSALHYSDGELADVGVTACLEKPFSMTQYTTVVHQLLHPAQRIQC